MGLQENLLRGIYAYDFEKLSAIQQREPHGSIGAVASHRIVAQFNSAEIAENLFWRDSPFWRLYAASHSHLEETNFVNALVRNVKRSLNGNPKASPRSEVYPIEPFNDCAMNLCNLVDLVS